MSLKNTIALSALLAITATPAFAASKHSIQKKEDSLAAAGFVVKPANTPARLDMLKRLPANKFVQRVRGDNVAYVYADPKNCNCLYVGSQAAYGAYRQQVQQKQIADEQLDAANSYNDASWDWGAWGPWGGRWTRFGFGRGW